MTDVFISSIKFPQCTDKYNNKNSSIASFLPRVLMYQKSEISLPVEYKTARPKTGDWEWLWRHFRTSNFAKKNPDFSDIFLYFLTNNALLYLFLANLLAHNNWLTDWLFDLLLVIDWFIHWMVCYALTEMVVSV